jgi:WD40 repeat protein
VTYESAARDIQRLVLQVWDLDSGLEVSRAPLEEPVDVRFHPDGDRLLIPSCACSEEEPIWWYDIATGEREVVLSGAFTGADISPDGSLIATGGGDRVATLWDASSGDQVVSLFGHRDILGDVAFSHDGSRLATTGQDGEVRIWAVPSGELELVLAGQVGLIWGVSWSDDGSRLATGSAQSGVKIWDMTVAGGASVAGHDFGVERIVNLEMVGDRVAVLGRQCLVGVCLGRAIVLDLDEGVVRDLPDRGGAGAALTEDGARIWTQASVEGLTVGQVDLVDLGSGRRVTSLAGICKRPPDHPECQFSPPIPPWYDQIRRFAISPDGDLLATLGLGNVALWNAESSDLIAVIPQWWLGPVVFDQFGIGFSPDGELLAVDSTDGVLMLDVRGMRSMDADRMIELDAELRVALDAGDNENTHEVQAATDRLTSLVPIVATLPVADAWRVEFSSDGRLLAVSSPTGGTRVFETAGWRQRHEMRPSWDVDISPDGTTLATLDTDGIARLWNLADGRLTQTIPVVSRGLGRNEGALRFAPNGRHILVTDGGRLMVHTTDVPELLDVARSRVTRALTPEECERYLQGCPSGAESKVTSPTP